MSGAAQRKFSVVIPAGKRPGADPVAQAGGKPLKALVEINGAPMITRVARALCASALVDEVIIAADPLMPDFADIPGLLDAFGDICVTRVETAPTISRSVQAALAAARADASVLITTCDHALLTTGMVDEFLSRSSPEGVSVGFVGRDTIEAAYPNMQRTYLPFADISVSGANLFTLSGADARRAIAFWENVEANRKKPWKVIGAFGLANLIGFKLGIFTLEAALNRAGKVIGCRASPVLLTQANAAIDVDKVSDLETVRAILAGA